MKKLIGMTLAAALALFILIQFVPYGRDHTNPPVTQAFQWPSPETQQVAERACYDCHSNETSWPWYTNLAPVSWLVQHDVEEGRSKLNFSQWGQGRQELREARELIEEGEMPMPIYMLMHPTARLTDQEKELLINSLSKVHGLK